MDEELMPDTVECDDCGDVLDIVDSIEYDGSTLCYGCEWRRNYEDVKNDGDSGVLPR